MTTLSATNRRNVYAASNINKSPKTDDNKAAMVSHIINKVAAHYKLK